MSTRQKLALPIGWNKGLGVMGWTRNWLISRTGCKVSQWLEAVWHDDDMTLDDYHMTAIQLAYFALLAFVYYFSWSMIL
jgi:hypothetical protein